MADKRGAAQSRAFPEQPDGSRRTLLTRAMTVGVAGILGGWNTSRGAEPSQRSLCHGSQAPFPDLLLF